MEEPNPDKVKAGLARAESLSPEERKEIARKAAIARWGDADIPRATHSGNVKIGEMSFPCSVLSDGTRILTQNDFMAGMGMYYSGWIAKNKSKEEATAGLPHFLAFKSLEPYIHRHLGDLQSIVLRYKTEKGGLAHGIKAALIPKLCEVWLDADEDKKLGTRQKQIAQRAKIIMRALAHVGIIALVDEATGYQAIRDRVALQTILDKYLTDEWAKWKKTFPDEFYKELFRLKGIPYPPAAGGRKPQYVGHWTNDIIFDRLAPGVRRELRIKNPKNEHGNKARKDHQHLTRDYGHPHLKELLTNVIFLLRGSTSWNEFKKLLDRSRPKYGATPEMDLEFED